MSKKDIISLEEVLLKYNKHNSEFIDKISKEEERENVGSFESIKNNIDNDIKAINYSTNLNKINFINEIKRGLGDEIKSNPNKINIIEKPKMTWFTKIRKIIQSLFTKF